MTLIEVPGATLGADSLGRPTLPVLEGGLTDIFSALLICLVDSFGESSLLLNSLTRSVEKFTSQSESESESNSQAVKIKLTNN